MKSLKNLTLFAGLLLGAIFATTASNEADAGYGYGYYGHGCYKPYYRHYYKPYYHHYNYTPYYYGHGYGCY